jgi:hypothetical protein
VLIFEELQGLVVPAVAHQSDKALDADMGRTGGLAGGGSLFGYAERAGYSLWILLENCLTEIEQFVVFVGAGNRADLGALAAARAFCLVYKSGCLMNFCGKVSGLAFEAQKLGVREKLNIKMTADLDQFR